MDLLYSVDQLNLIFAKSRDAVFLMKKQEGDYQYKYLNEAAVKLIEMNPIGKTVLNVISPHLTKNILHYYDLALDRQEQMEFEDYTYTKFEVRKQKTSVIPVIHEQQEYVLAITREVAVGREMEDKYLFMRSVFFKTFLSTILVSTDMQLLEANPKFVSDFNIHLDEIQQKGFFDLPFIEASSIDSLKEYMNRAINGENLTSKMLYFIDKNKKRRCYTATFTSLTSNGEIIAVFIILQEITAFIKQGEELRSVSHGLETLKNAISSAADIIFTNTDGIIVDVNDRVIENTGFSREEMIGNSHNMFNSGHHSKEFFKTLWGTVKAGKIWRDEVCNRNKDGELYWVDSTIIPIMNEQGEVDQYLTFQYNISSKKRLMSELYKIESTFQAITENTNDFILIANKYGVIKYASPSYIRKLGYSEKELIGQSYEQFLTPESLDLWKKEMKKNKVTGKLENKIDLQLVTKNNETFWTEGNYTITLDMTQKISDTVMVSREITERKQLEDNLTYLAYHDSLTHLGNRRMLMREFPEICENAQRNNEAVALFYLDGDNFKQINDLYGHDVGDEFLIGFGKAIEKSIRANDLVVRLGGDEFLIVVTDLSLDEDVREVQLKQIVERIRQQLKEGFIIRDLHFSPTTSIGISIYPHHSESLESLVDLADRALYQAKQISKNTYCICDSNLMI
jgi:diguanylate cyclase (GGDEF)-like protein/PAS domain S-box-containing protein